MDASSHPASTTDVDSTIAPRDVRQQIERICASDSFQRSRRLKDFLRYITDLTLAGQQEEINEFLIGVDVFGRGPNYNPSEDSVVRRQAHSLRQKLDDYYSSAGVGDPILVEVPLGHYIPAFRRRAEAQESGDAPAAKAERLRSETPALSWRRWAWALPVLAAMAFVAGRLTVDTPTSARSGEFRATSALQELWSPWLAADQDPVIVFSSPMTGVVKYFSTPLPPDSLPRRLEMTGEMERSFRQRLGVPDGGKLYISPSVTEAKSGEALGAVQLAAVFGANGFRPRSIQSRLLTWEAFRRENLIILGHSEQNHVVGPLLEKYPLRLAETKGERPRRILNTDPRAGEPPYFEIAYAEDENDATLEYALISMLPGLDDGRELLLVSGLNTQATLMGIEFLTDPDRVRSFLDGLHDADPDHEGPWRFQVVLSAEVHDKAPTGGNIELVRVLEAE